MSGSVSMAISAPSSDKFCWPIRERPMVVVRFWVMPLLLLWMALPSASFTMMAFPSSTATSSIETRLENSASSDSDNVITVALTREVGKNEKFRAALLRHFEESSAARTAVQPIELPCIAHADGPDFDKLQDTLQETAWDYVAITSPEAARVLASAWPWRKDRQRPQSAATTQPPAVVAVGKATETALQEAEIEVRFCPSKATAKVLVQELPMPAAAAANGSNPQTAAASASSNSKVLYPASARAKPTLQEGLQERGFCVTRLDTYDTVTAVWNEDEKERAAAAAIACFASPSAVQGWLQNTKAGNHNTRYVRAACIGETSANECREQGWPEEYIFHPEKPGLEGWVHAVAQAVESMQQH